MVSEHNQYQICPRCDEYLSNLMLFFLHGIKTNMWCSIKRRTVTGCFFSFTVLFLALQHMLSRTILRWQSLMYFYSSDREDGIWSCDYRFIGRAHLCNLLGRDYSVVASLLRSPFNFFVVFYLFCRHSILFLLYNEVSFSNPTFVFIFFLFVYMS